MICYLFPQPSYFIFSPDVPALLYYAHIPTVLICFLFSFYIFWNNRQALLNRILLGIAILFTLWTIINLIAWTNINSNLIMFVWSFLGTIQGLIAISYVYFTYVFLEKKDVSFRVKAVFLVLLTPILLLASTRFNLSGFDITTCDAFQFEWPPYKIYSALLGLIAIVWILVLLIRKYRASTPTAKKEIRLFGFGVELALVMFFGMEFLAAYLTKMNLLPDSGIEIYGMFGVDVFIVYIIILVVRFGEFNVKLIATQALVDGLAALIAAKLFMSETRVDRIITVVTLVAVGFFGYFLVRSVKKEIKARERIETLAQELNRSAHTLQVANEGQKNLIHIMNHQIKGFLGVNKNIFAELLQTDDYGKMPEDAKPLLAKGLESTTAGVNYVCDILAGSSAANGTLPYNMKPIDLRNFDTKLFAQQKEIAEKAGMSFEAKIGPGDYALVGDATQLEEAFKNLITNAIKYNSPKGKIAIELSRNSNGILFSVKDTGVGIADEDKSRLFTPGGRGKDSIKYNADSSGFGLAFVKGVVEHHNGKVSYKSNSPEAGTTFLVELPIGTA
jgi:signal transduction histidine kinase